MSSFGMQIAAVVATLFITTTASSAQSSLKVDGSTGAMPLVAALAKAYEAKTPNLRIEIGKGLGGKARIEALRTASIDLAVASHGLKVDDLVKQGMVVEEIARTPVVFGVNESVPVTDLSSSQVCAIYSASVTNWKSIGGPDLAIAAHTRPDSEVDAEVARSGIACLNTLKMPDTVKVMQRGGDMAKALAATKGAIGMTTTTVAEQSAGKIKSLSLDGVAPTAPNVIAGKYRLAREVYLVSKESALPATKSFLEFVKSGEGAKVIKANGAIPKAGG